jgi:hypothetical protein
MENIKCSVDGEMLKEDEPHCSIDHQTMTCAGQMCTCACGNTVPVSEIKCDAHLEM